MSEQMQAFFENLNWLARSAGETGDTEGGAE